jgi:hypothetical protein
MKKLFIILILSATLTPIFSQEAAKEAPVTVANTFGTGTLIDNQTLSTPYKGGIELQIHHRFSLIENYHNLFGVYGSANTRIGLNYGISDKLMVGAGTTKDYQLQDVQVKYRLLEQTADNQMPVSVALYGNMVFDLRKEEAFGLYYKFIHRLSYFSQVIVARKFGEKISIQVAPEMAYMNAVPTTDTTRYKNINFGLSAGLRANLFGAHSLIAEYDQLLTKQDLSKNPDLQPKPNIALGWEIGTGTHTFQIFVANYNKILNQYNLLYNTNDFSKGKYLVGFNIAVRF